MYEELSQKLDGFLGSRRLENDKIEQSWIDEAEAELGYRLPDSYRWWLREFGSLHIGGSEVFTLAPPEQHESAIGDLIYNERLHLEKDWIPADRLYILVPSTDEEFFFDVSSPVRETGVPVEYPIMRFQHLGGKVEVYAHSFAEFLEQLLRERGH